MDFATFGALAASALVAAKLMDLVKNLQAGAVKDAITQVAAFGVGVLVAFLLTATDWADGIKVGDAVLGSLSPWSVVLLGLWIGGSGQYAYDLSPRNTPSLGERATG